jgi:hypothetical protein
VDCIARTSFDQLLPAARRIALIGVWCVPLAGCLAPGGALTERDHVIARAARPILTLDSDACWTDSFNTLVETGPDAVAWLMRQPAITEPAAPDDLRVMMHTSLVRLLVSRAAGPPELSATTLETGLSLLHFELKVGGESVGPIIWEPGAPPGRWPALFPAMFDHVVAGGIDVEGDRRALVDWWRRRQREPVPLAPPLRPVAAHLWPVLSRRYADRWEYNPDPRPLHCSARAAGRARPAVFSKCALQPRGDALLELPTADYNLVRAACIWLGRQSATETQNRLIALIGSENVTIAHNARFALRFSPDERIRAVLRRYGTPLPGDLR